MLQQIYELVSMLCWLSSGCNHELTKEWLEHWVVLEPVRKHEMKVWIEYWKIKAFCGFWLVDHKNFKTCLPDWLWKSSVYADYIVIFSRWTAYRDHWIIKYFYNRIKGESVDYEKNKSKQEKKNSQSVDWNVLILQGFILYYN